MSSGVCTQVGGIMEPTCEESLTKEAQGWPKHVIWESLFRKTNKGFPGGPVVKNPPGNAGDIASVPSWGRSHMLQGN